MSLPHNLRTSGWHILFHLVGASIVSSCGGLTRPDFSTNDEMEGDGDGDFSGDGDMAGAKGDGDSRGTPGDGDGDGDTGGTAGDGDGDTGGTAGDGDSDSDSGGGTGDIDDCSSNPCENGATCRDQVDGFVCDCLDGFEGTLCELDIDDCSPDSCLNGGDCVDGMDTFTCNCATGFEGDFCEARSPRCDPSKPFEVPVQVVAGLNKPTEKELGGAVTVDGLTLYVNYEDSVVLTTRDTLYDSFQPPAATSLFNTLRTEMPALVLQAFTSNGLEVFFQDGPNVSVYSATRSNTTSAFGDPVLHEGVLSPNDLPLFRVWVSPDGARLYGTEVTVYNLYYVQRSGSAFGNPQALDGLESGISNADSPRMTADEEILYVASTNSGSLGSADIFRAQRADMSSSFGSLTHVANVNSNLGDAPVYVSGDDCELFIQRSSSSPVAEDGIYVARRPL